MKHETKQCKNKECRSKADRMKGKYPLFFFYVDFIPARVAGYCSAKCQSDTLKREANDQ